MSLPVKSMPSEPELLPPPRAGIESGMATPTPKSPSFWSNFGYWPQLKRNSIWRTISNLWSSGSNEKIRVFALVVGIDSYRFLHNLDGAVHDAKSVQGLLKKRLRVPDSHIVMLLNEEATRKAIISSFQTQLIGNPEIRPGDAIIFYFAGHGSQVDAPLGWVSEGNKIEMICPHDEGTDSAGNTIYGIPDRTIAKLIRELADAKGDNITVIFDCCHSGGITRVPARKVGKVRYAANTTPIPPSIDSAILNMNHRNTKFSAGFTSPNPTSYVLLAACRQNELAWESVTATGLPCGAFTNCLVRQLHRVAFDKVTYSMLINSLEAELVSQHPQCEGLNKNRFLFHGVAAPIASTRFLVRRVEGGGYSVDAGDVQGVVVGTEFSIRESPITSTDETLGTLVAVSVGIESSTLDRRLRDQPFDIPPDSMAVVTKWNNDKFMLKVFLQLGSNRETSTVPAIKNFPSKLPQKPEQLFRQVLSPELADLVVEGLDNGHIGFQRLDLLISENATVIPRVTVVPEDLSRVLDAIAHFNFYLYHRNVTRPMGDDVKLALHRLKEVPGEWGHPIMVPDGQDLVSNHLIVVTLEPGALYGITLTNNSPHDLFPYVFYFDPADYSIQLWYEPPSRSMAAPLRGKHDPNESPPILPIGYGSTGTDPFEFYLDPGLNIDTGFIKLFVSSKYVDMAWITQQSVLDIFLRRMRGTLDGDAWDAWVTIATVCLDSTKSDTSVT